MEIVQSFESRHTKSVLITPLFSKRGGEGGEGERGRGEEIGG